MKKRESFPLSVVECKLKIRFATEDNSHLHFEDTWNVEVDAFTLQSNKDFLSVSFSFEAQLITVENGKRISIIPGESLPEFQEYSVKLNILLDLLSLHAGTPLVIVDGSHEFSGVGFLSKTNEVTNTHSLVDVEGLSKRLTALSTTDNSMTNTIRFFRLSKIDKEYSGKAIKLWASLEALYGGYEKGNVRIWDKLSMDDTNSLEKAIESLSFSKGSIIEQKAWKERLLLSLQNQTIKSPREFMANELSLMGEDGKYTSDDIVDLLKWWGKSRHSSAHGSRIKDTDENKRDAIDNIESTLEMLLQSKVTPSMHAYFIGNPKDVQGFWDPKDFTITKASKNCWVKPVEWGQYLLNTIGSYKVNDNDPLIYVSHNRVVKVTSDELIDIENISSLPGIYQKTIKKIQRKLNKKERS